MIDLYILTAFEILWILAGLSFDAQHFDFFIYNFYPSFQGTKV